MKTKWIAGLMTSVLAVSMLAGYGREKQNRIRRQQTGWRGGALHSDYDVHRKHTGR